MKKRLGIFVFYDAEGKAQNYVEHLINSVFENISELVIIVNGKLTFESRRIFEKYTDEIYIRDNSGFDGTAWKEATIKYIGIPRLKEFDEVVYFNDIAYGPICSLKTIFDEMDEKTDVDFWGFTVHYTAYDSTGHHADKLIPTHIQTYFFAVRQHMVKDNSFQEFWEEMPEIKTMLDDIGLFETAFTKYFADRGFNWFNYVQMDQFRGAGIDNYCYNYERPYTLISDCKSPFIRRKSLTQFTPNSSGGPEIEPRRVIRYINEKSDYDVNFIWDDLLRKNNIFDLYSRLHLDYILPNSRSFGAPQKHTIALLLHIYYEDQVEYCYRYARSMPGNADIYITTTSERTASRIETVFSGMECNHLEIRRVKNRGRDMSALYVGCADVVKSGKYDFICCIHDKKSPQVGSLMGASFRDLTFESVLSTKEYVENIINLFDEEPRLGYLGFPYMIGGEYWNVMRDAWASPNNYAATVNVLEKCEIKVNLSSNKPPICYGNVFWCRPAAILPLIQMDLTYEDFDKEPLPIDGTFSHALERAPTYCAQSQGYYSGVLYTEEYAEAYIPALMIECSRLAARNAGIPSKITTETASTSAYLCPAFGFKEALAIYINKHIPFLFKKTALRFPTETRNIGVKEALVIWIYKMLK